MRLSLEEVRRDVKSELAKLNILQTLVFSNKGKAHRLSSKRISSPLGKVYGHPQSNGDPIPFGSVKYKRTTQTFKSETSHQYHKPILTCATSITSFNCIDEDSFLKNPIHTALNNQEYQNNVSQLIKANMLLQQKVKNQHELIEELQGIIDKLT